VLERFLATGSVVLDDVEAGDDKFRLCFTQFDAGEDEVLVPASVAAGSVVVDDVQAEQSRGRSQVRQSGSSRTEQLTRPTLA
jgi:hypothetical protein